MVSSDIQLFEVLDWNLLLFRARSEWTRKSASARESLLSGTSLSPTNDTLEKNLFFVVMKLTELLRLTILGIGDSTP